MSDPETKIFLDGTMGNLRSELGLGRLHWRLHPRLRGLVYPVQVYL